MIRTFLEKLSKNICKQHPQISVSEKSLQEYSAIINPVSIKSYICDSQYKLREK